MGGPCVQAERRSSGLAQGREGAAPSPSAGALIPPAAPGRGVGASWALNGWEVS